MSPRRLIALAATVAVVAMPACARADGDPASDVLLQQDVFLPYSPPTSDGVARALLDLTRRTRADGWPIKVAIVASPNDLGAYGSLFSDPQHYTNVLAQELRNPRLLVVTPVGFGGRQLGDGVNRALAGLEPVQGGGDRLARQALIAVARLAAEDGHRVTMPPVDTSPRGRRPYRETAQLHGNSPGAATTPGAPRSGSGEGGSPVLVYGGPVALIVALLLGMSLRDRLRRRASAPADPVATPPAEAP